MLGIAEHKLKCVLARRQLYTCLGLPCAEMKMVLVLGNCIVWIDRFIDINQQVMMPAIRKIVTRMRNAHVAQTKATPKPSFHRRPVLWPNEIQNGILCSKFPLSARGKRAVETLGESPVEITGRFHLCAFAWPRR